MHTMTEPTNQFTITLAQVNPTVGDIDGNAAKARVARAARPGRRRRSAGVAGAVHHRLSAGRPRAEAGVPGGLPRGDRDPGARDRRRRPGRADRQSLGRGRQALQRLCAPGRRAHRGAALQGQSAELRRVRRKAPVRPRAGGRPGDRARRSRRCPDLRGHLAGRVGGLRERRRMPRRDRRRDHRGAERLALCPRQGRRAAVDRGGAGHRKRAAAGLSQPGRRPGRTGVRRRLLRPECRSVGRGAAAGLRRGHRHAALDQRRGRLALFRPGGAAARRRPGRLCRLCARPARLRPQERVSRGAAGHFGRHRFGAVRGDRGRCARRRQGAWRHAAVSLHRAGFAR